MSGCAPDMDALLAERASGDLTPLEAARVNAHLAECPHCRDEVAAYERAFALVRVPGSAGVGQPGEEGAGAGLVQSTLAAWKARRRLRIRLALGGLAALAAALALSIAPALLAKKLTPNVHEAAPVAAAWDADGTLSAVAYADLEDQARSSDETANATTADVALAALDATQVP
ncbi:MAG TPA: zf-HC2 domain-containing protein [Anaeromyxobacteraceae bacterium]|nr:zf-HC2 domain-containing protein [Anaeromyxobacteraceae bacterium]